MAKEKQFMSAPIVDRNLPNGLENVRHADNGIHL